jgi:hypothetical protein
MVIPVCSCKKDNIIENAIIVWLRKGFDNKGKYKSHLAEACNVSRQAVGDWVKNGQVHKRHLTKISEYIELPIPRAVLGGSEGDSTNKIENGFEKSTELMLHIKEALLRLERDLTVEEFNLIFSIFNNLKGPFR